MPLLLAVGSCGSSDSSRLVLPDVNLRAMANSQPVNASTLRGPALVNLWATWCAPCRREIPDLQRLHDELGAKVRIVGINIGDDEASVTAFLDELGVTFEQYLDSDGTVEVALRVSGLPATAVIDADGVVVEVHQGVLDTDGFRRLIDKNL